MDEKNKARILVIDDDPFFRSLLRATEETAPIPVIFASSQRDSNTLMEAERLGVAGYLTKPFQSEQLLETVANCLAQGEQRSLHA